ncbi:MAG: hypothetical protein HY400_06250 [Elusimicrobia bacterium]|nr:hypothetical protein [Elusimicrobiota bacterium]
MKAFLVSDPSIKGASERYLGWHDSAQKLILMPPDQGIERASSLFCSTGTIRPENLGVKFTLTTRLVDAFCNQVYDDQGSSAESDVVTLITSKPGGVSVSTPAAMTAGMLVGYATVFSSGVCNSTVTFTAHDVTSPSAIADHTVSVFISSCTGGVPPVQQNEGFYQLSAPNTIVAATSFSMDIIVKNVTINDGSGDVQYKGTLVPLLQTNPGEFSSASGILGVGAFDFPIDDNLPDPSDVTHNIPNQTYNVAEVIYIELVAEKPDALAGATAIAGPIQVFPGAPSKIVASASPSVMGARSVSKVTVSLVDLFNNGISNKTLTVDMIQGSQGGLNTLGNRFLSLTTNALGFNTLNFLSGDISENIVLRVAAPTYPSIAAVDLSITVTLIGDAVVAAYPSPVKITERPLNIEYRLDQDSEVTLLITDLFGQEVWRRTYSPGVSGGMKGFNKVLWDGVNGIGHTVATGVYALHIEITANGQTSKTKTRFGVRK